MKTETLATKQGRGTTLLELSVNGREAVSGLEIQHFRIWFSGVEIPAGGIASVYTKEGYRHQGYAEQCMRHALELERRKGELVSILFAVPDYYERFGYAVVMPWFAIHVSLEAWKELPPEPKWSDFAPRHRDGVLEIYQENAKKRAGPVSRDSSFDISPLKPVRWRTQGVLRVLTDFRDKVEGYVYHRESGTEEFEVAEAFAVGGETYAKLFAYLLHETRRRGKKEFMAALPPDDPFALFLRRYDARFVMMRRRSGGGMARILNFPQLCESLTPVFRERVSGWRAERTPKELVLSAGDEQGKVELEGGSPAAEVESPLPLMTQVLFGYVGFEEALQMGLRASGMSQKLGGCLFPDLLPFMYLRDRF
jgi:predicted acetyltransferase